MTVNDILNVFHLYSHDTVLLPFRVAKIIMSLFIIGSYTSKAQNCSHILCYNLSQENFLSMKHSFKSLRMGEESHQTIKI